MKRIIFLASLFLFAHTFALAQTRKDGDKPDLNRGRTLYTVGYVHLDTQWNWDYTKTIDVFLKRTLERNFDLFEKYPDYIFTFTGARRYRMMKEYYPDLYAKMLGYVRQGRWIAGGSCVEESEVNVSSSESMIREVLYGNAYYEREFGYRSIDYMRVHLSQVGGITPARKLQMFCEQYGVRICWHGPGDMSPLAHAANIHIDLAAQNLGLQEWSGIEPPNFVIQKLKDNHGALLEVFPGMPEYGNDGFVYANDKPGLGVDLNEKEAAKYPCENTVTTWTQTRNRDGSLQTP